jgi:hypothetical protein
MRPSGVLLPFSQLAQRVPRRTLAAGETPPLTWGVAPTSGRHTCTPFFLLRLIFLLPASFYSQ